MDGGKARKDIPGNLWARGLFYDEVPSLWIGIFWTHETRGHGEDADPARWTEIQ
jgi:hypothetical protein